MSAKPICIGGIEFKAERTTRFVSILVAEGLIERIHQRRELINSIENLR